MGYFCFLRVGEFEIMAGDAAGVVTSFHPQEQFWRLSVSEHSARLLTSTTVRDRRLPVLHRNPSITS
ncbi:hypothetical protein BC938DRAFT_479671 [Jimgerdemannia flammicorona]|uniref:Uncharacterized protein n=1 Tax=Jimgerdemannia flammicorona TaxID=994334 RepID=A0A433QXV5_9FUNG|nr:hypothetical protein BC938DRAFT_479671 [Jimgerdemannia flammicorona]